MPTYCFRKVPSGEPIELVISMAEIGKFMEKADEDGKIPWNGREIIRDFRAEFERGRAIFKPFLSDAFAVHPDQIEERGRELAALGVPTQFADDGRVLVESRQHRNKLLEVHHWHDLDAGYGDR